MNDQRLELLKKVHHRYGYDFSGYSKNSLNRRLDICRIRQGFGKDEQRFSERLLSDESLMTGLINDLSIPVTEMFRDPLVFKSLREKIIPVLATHPHIRIWCAGVASGEEAWSMAILLEEAGLLSRSLIYATDFHAARVKKAAEGKLKTEKFDLYSANYAKSGGQKRFTDYLHIRGGEPRLRPELLNRIVFAPHNLVSDGSFNEFHLILCRNVMIYFNESLNARVLQLFNESLISCGHLCLGSKEHLRFLAGGHWFEECESGMRIFRKKV